MLYAMLCYHNESMVGSWSKERDAQVMAEHQAALKGWAQQGKLGPVARLVPTTAAVTVRRGREPLVLDGPFAETKEQLLGFYLVECASLAEATEFAESVATTGGLIEVRPVLFFQPGNELPGVQTP